MIKLNKSNTMGWFKSRSTRIQNIQLKSTDKLCIDKLLRKDPIMIKNIRRKAMWCKFFQKMNLKKEKEKSNKLCENKRKSLMKFRNKNKEKGRDKGNDKEKEKDRDKDKNNDVHKRKWLKTLNSVRAQLRRLWQTLSLEIPIRMQGKSRHHYQNKTITITVHPNIIRPTMEARVRVKKKPHGWETKRDEAFTGRSMGKRTNTLTELIQLWTRMPEENELGLRSTHNNWNKKNT